MPCVPGYSGEDQSDGALQTEAERIGFPLMVKAAAGGGGRGMRLVARPSELADALRAARAEAESAFGSGELILEKAVVEPRHVEVQVFGDSLGNMVHLGERDCSVQRRHQKVIEESPSPAVDAALRAKMGAAAVEAARACGYVGAGTVEFLLDSDRRFYFLEMNTRLQVEHPVTELVTGIDLVEWQLRVADGEPLPMQQEEIRMTGHAIEARLYAEDPARNYVPQTGRILAWRPPEGTDIRVDSGVTEGGSITPYYDPMIAKLVAHGAHRESARRKLAHGLRATTVLGVVTNKTFLANICDSRAFGTEDVTTAFLAKHFADDPSCRVEPPPLSAFATAALIVFLDGARGIVEDDSFIGWRSAGPVWVSVRIASGETTAALRVVSEGSGKCGRRFAVTRAEDDKARVELEVMGRGDGELAVSVDGVRRTVRYAVDEDRVWVDDGQAVRIYVNLTHAPAKPAGAASTGRLTAPLDGAVRQVFVAPGDAVDKGQLVLVMEAMKMEHQIRADVDGKVVAVHTAAGTQVKTRQLLAEIVAHEEQA